MKIAIVSDTHGSQDDLKIPKVDWLIHCGDFTNTGNSKELNGVNNWITDLKKEGTIKKAITCGGNHELSLERFPDAAKSLLTAFDHILIHEGLEVDGLKIWGCPYVPRFFNWAFMRDEDDLYWIYNQIPVGLDILVCHGPPRGHLDWNGREHAGSVSMKEVLSYKQPKFYLCGHIHNQQGVDVLNHSSGNKTVIINAANMNANYIISTSPIILEI